MSTSTFRRRRAHDPPLCGDCGEVPSVRCTCPGCTEIRRVKQAAWRRAKGIPASTKPCSKCGEVGHTAIRHRVLEPRPEPAPCTDTLQPPPLAVSVHGERGSPPCPA